MRLNKLTQGIALGMINCNIPFAGASALSAGSGVSAAPAQTAPIQGQVPNPSMSKVIPGVPATVDSSAPVIVDGKVVESPSPLDNYAGLFDNSPKLDAEGKVIDDSPPATILDAQLTDFTKSAANLDFSASITPEILAGVQDEDGKLNLEGLVALINTTNKATYAQALNTATGITRKGVEIAGDAGKTTAQNLMVANTVTALVGADNPTLVHPAYAQTTAAIQELIIKQNPDKTPQQIATLVTDYFKLTAAPDSSKPSELDADPNGLLNLFDLPTT